MNTSPFSVFTATRRSPGEGNDGGGGGGSGSGGSDGIIGIICGGGGNDRRPKDPPATKLKSSSENRVTLPIFLSIRSEF